MITHHTQYKLLTQINLTLKKSERANKLMQDNATNIQITYLVSSGIGILSRPKVDTSPGTNTSTFSFALLSIIIKSSEDCAGGNLRPVNSLTDSRGSCSISALNALKGAKLLSVGYNERLLVPSYRSLIDFLSL